MLRCKSLGLESEPRMLFERVGTLASVSGNKLAFQGLDALFTRFVVAAVLHLGARLTSQHLDNKAIKPRQASAVLGRNARNMYAVE
jgi:hypothetical protein